MEPATTLIAFTAATVSALATASPKWGCYESQIRTRGFAYESNPLNIIIGGKTAETEIASAKFVESVSSGYEELKMELKSYLELSHGWDGPESKAPSEEVIATALLFVDGLPSGIPLPKPMLSASGETGLYWDVGNIYADVSFEGEGMLSIFVRDRIEERETFDEISISDAKIDRLKVILSPLA